MQIHGFSPHAPWQPGAALVLIAEDEAPFAQVLAALLEEEGYQVLLASHGQQALDLARQHQPDLILTDLMMPQMNGRELIAAVREASVAAGQPVPACILMTAAGSTAVRGTLADAVLFKPFDLENLLVLLRQYLSSPPLEEPGALDHSVGL